MIILDEQLQDQGLRDGLNARFPAVRTVKDLGWAGADDKELPALLRRHPGCIFVTINITDFWGQVDGHPKYCIVCLDLRTDQTDKIADCLQALLNRRELKTRAGRSGKVIRISGWGTPQRSYSVRKRATQRPGKPVNF